MHEVKTDRSKGAIKKLKIPIRDIASVNREIAKTTKTQKI